MDKTYLSEKSFRVKKFCSVTEISPVSKRDLGTRENFSFKDPEPKCTECIRKETLVVKLAVICCIYLTALSGSN